MFTILISLKLATMATKAYHSSACHTTSFVECWWLLYVQLSLDYLFHILLCRRRRQAVNGATILHEIIMKTFLNNQHLCRINTIGIDVIENCVTSIIHLERNWMCYSNLIKANCNGNLTYKGFTIGGTVLLPI